jgi:hypothetical protein
MIHHVIIVADSICHCDTPAVQITITVALPRKLALTCGACGASASIGWGALEFVLRRPHEVPPAPGDKPQEEPPLVYGRKLTP